MVDEQQNRCKKRHGQGVLSSSRVGVAAGTPNHTLFALRNGDNRKLGAIRPSRDFHNPDDEALTPMQKEEEALLMAEIKAEEVEIRLNRDISEIVRRLGIAVPEG